MPLGTSPWSCLAYVSHSAETCPTSNTGLFQTHTGNTVRALQTHTSDRLGGLGYLATSMTELSLVQGINEKDTKEMVFEIVLVSVTLEAVLEPQAGGRSGQAERHCPAPAAGAAGQRAGEDPPLPPGGPARPRPLRGHVWSERSQAQGPDHQSSLPVAPRLPEVSTSPHSPFPGPMVPWIRRATPAQARRGTWPTTVAWPCAGHPVSQGTPLSGPPGKQPQGPALALSPLSGETVAPRGAAGSSPGSLVQPLRTEGSPLPDGSAHHQLPNCQGGPGPQARSAATAGLPWHRCRSPSISSGTDELCERLPGSSVPSSSSHARAFPGLVVEENRQSEPLMGPETAKHGSPDTWGLWRSAQAPLLYEGPQHSLHPSPTQAALEVPVSTQGHHPGHR